MTARPSPVASLAAAGRCVRAAEGLRTAPPSGTQRSAVHQLSRIAATIARLLADLHDQLGLSPVHERDVGTRVGTARLALARAIDSLQPVAAGASTATPDPHPDVGYLATAAENLAACQDLLQTHFTTDSDTTRTGTSDWATVITPGRVTAALLSDDGRQFRHGSHQELMSKQEIPRITLNTR